MTRGRLALFALSSLSVLLLVISAYALWSINTWLFPAFEDEGDVPSQHNPASIKVERADWSQCRDEQGTPQESYWLVLHVNNGDSDHWVKGRGTMRIINAAGGLVGAVPFGGLTTLYWEPYTQSDLTLAANSQNWLMPPDMLRQRLSIRAVGGPTNHVELKLEESDWFKRDGSEAGYSWETELASHTAAAGQYPRHSINVRIENNGRATMRGVKVFGVVHNSKGQLVDILWSEEPDRWPTGRTLKPGESRVIEAQSIAQTGRCIGEADPAGYTVEYWINAMTSSGQPLTSNHIVTVP